MAVTDEDVEHVRRAFESFNATAADREDEAGIRAHCARWYDPDVEIVNADNWPVPASYRGTEGYVRWYRENYGPYEDVRYDVDFLGAVGDRVVALVTISGHPRGESTELEVQVGLVYGMRSGRIARVELYLGHDRALQAARATAVSVSPPAALGAGPRSRGAAGAARQSGATTSSRGRRGASGPGRG